MIFRRWLSLVLAASRSIYRQQRCTLVILLLLLLICVYYRRCLDAVFGKDIPVELIHYRHLLESNGSSSNICNIPQLDPWDATILKYYSKPKPLRCRYIQNNVTVLRHGVLMVLNEYRDKLKCRCRTFEHNTGISDFDLKYDDWVDVDPASGTKIEKEFVEVECYSNGLIPSKSYSYHWNQVIERNASIKGERPFEKSSLDRPSVLMFGFDGMSRSNFIRVLPKTYTQLQKMGFVDLRGHVKIGDNTFPNLCAILTGERSSSTREFKGTLPDKWDIYFDDWPFIWNNFSEQGYVTLLAEDRPDIGTFNYLGWLRGFRYPPTDHYLRPYWIAVYWSLLFRRSSPGCYDRLPAHTLQLNYISEFLTKYDGTRSFALHWTQDLSHDYLNAINVADEDFERFFIESAAKFNNTIVIVFSDHGHRYDAIRETVVGRLEARLPFASVLLPKEFVSKYPHTLKALRKNADKMTTQFDFYATLINIALGNFSRITPPEKVQRGYDLLAPTPAVRQCYEANVPEDYCPCFDELQIETEEARQPAIELMNFANTQLALARLKGANQTIRDGFRCAKLILDKIEYASVWIPPAMIVKDPHVGNNLAKHLELSYRVVVRVKPPSDALLEGVIVKDLINDMWRVTGEIERNNKYGNTSHCVINPLLKKLCYCISLL